MNKQVAPAEKIVLLGLFLALGMILALFEAYIPRPLPWAKPGLANVVALVTLYVFGITEEMLLN